MRSFVQFIVEENSTHLIQPEIEYLKNWSAKHPWIKATHIVGSFAQNHPDHLPDRNGPRTSDVDFMVEPHHRGEAADKHHAWKHLADLEQDFPKKFNRSLHSNLEAPNARGGAHVTIHSSK